MSLIAERFLFRGVWYESRWVKCGKKLCGKCPHGPYWYAIILVPDQKPVTRYVGKHLKGAALKHYDDEYNGGNTTHGTPTNV